MDNLTVPTMAEMLAKGETPEILFWVGCAGSFDERAQKIAALVIRQSVQEMNFCSRCRP